MSDVFVEPRAIEVDVVVGETPIQVVEVGTLVSQGPVGPTGPAGPEGPQGPPGVTGAAASGTVFVQGVPDDVWTITHGLGYFPNVTVVDSTGSEVEGEVKYQSISVIILTFSAAFSGKAYLS